MLGPSIVVRQTKTMITSDDYDGVKRYCTHLIRHQMKNDVFMAGLLGRLVELEAILAKKDLSEERKTMDRIKKFFHN